MLTHGCGSEAHMNMDVNLRWLPEQIITISEFLVLLAGYYVAFGFCEQPVISFTQQIPPNISPLRNFIKYL